MMVSVIYASKERQVEKMVKIDASTTIAVAIKRSDIMLDFPEIDLSTMRVGVFGKLKKLDDLLQDGDRIEIYRPLEIDPKTARALRATKRAEVARS